MHKLERTPAPACLERFRHGANNWGDVTPEHKKEIWQQLEAMQGRFCAYCERSIRRKSKDSHIEHFVRCDNEKKKTFDWNNLFGSCQGKGTCGDHKDNKAKHINMEHVCKPDTMNPEDFLQFLPDGSVQPKPGLSTHEHSIAEMTIAVFNLNSIELTNARRSVYSAEFESAKYIFQCFQEASSDIELWGLLQSNLARIAAENFTAARLLSWKLPDHQSKKNSKVLSSARQKNE